MTPPSLPAPRGPLSAAVIDAVKAVGSSARSEPARSRDVTAADPLGADLQLALYVSYELHYRSFAGVDDEAEWEPELLTRRRDLERVFLGHVRAQTSTAAGRALPGLLRELLASPAANGVSAYLERAGTRDELRELLVHRSLYHLKEADPQAWVIPRLEGKVKAGLVAVEFDEYGGGSGARMHSALFAGLMVELGLDATYGYYLDDVPAPMLAIVNFMSLCGLHRGLRGALIGQLAAVETTSPPGSKRMVAALARLGVEPAAQQFYAEHVIADSVHEQVMRRDVIGALIAAEPGLAADVVFGIVASSWLDDRLDGHLLASWAAGRSSLRAPVRTPALA